jgi:hypothetical protein
MGVLDPTKVTRTALQNAASIASLMLTTDAMVAELPKEDTRWVAAAVAWVEWAAWAAWTCKPDRSRVPCQGAPRTAKAPLRRGLFFVGLRYVRLARCPRRMYPPSVG